MSAEFYLKKFKKGVIIAPNKEHLEKLTNALYFFSERDPETFSKFRSTEAILVYPGEGPEDGLYEKDRIIVISSEAVENATIKYLSSILAHETWHLVQYESGDRRSINELEAEASQKQREFLTNVGDEESVKWLDEGLKRKWWIYKALDDKETTEPPPVRESFKKFLSDYKSGRLRIKEVLFDNPTLDGDDS